MHTALYRYIGIEIKFYFHVYIYKLFMMCFVFYAKPFEMK